MATLLSSGLNAPPPPPAAVISSSGRRTLHVVTCQASSSSSPQQHPVTVRRRSACLRLGALGLAAVQLLQPHHVLARAADGRKEVDDEEEKEPANNGWWLTEFPLPVPKIRNKEINNAETGTRSFLKKGVFMADIGPGFAAHAYRLRSTAFDLLALEDLLGKDASNYVSKYLRLKSTFMYYDFDKLITAAAVNGDDDEQNKQKERKEKYVDLANRLFDSFESLQQAVTARDDTKIGERYADTKVILQELMATMA